MNLKEKIFSVIQPLSNGVQSKASGIYSGLSNISSLGNLKKMTRALPYGISTRPAKSVWAYFLNLGGDLMSPIILAELDKMRPEPSTDGEVIFYCRNGSSYPVILTLKTDGTFHIKSETKVEVETPEVIVKAATKVEVQSPEVTVKSDKIELGKEALEKIINGESFQAKYNAHTHIFMGVPTGPVLAPATMTNADLSSVVKGAK